MSEKEKASDKIPIGTKIIFLKNIIELETGDHPGGVLAFKNSVAEITGEDAFTPNEYVVNNAFYAIHWKEFIELDFQELLNKAKAVTTSFYDFRGCFYNKEEMYQIYLKEKNDNHYTTGDPRNENNH